MRTTLALISLLLLHTTHAQPGTVDTTFHSGLAAGTTIHGLVALPDGKILIGGNFTTYDGVPCGRIARLLPDGALDTSFGGGAGFNSTVTVIRRLPDGDLLVAGAFTSYDGHPVSKAVKLSSDGVLDTTFAPDLPTVAQMAILPDGRILTFSIGSPFAFRRLMPDGALDTMFNGPTNRTQTFALLNDGRIMVGSLHQSGDFHCLHRLHGNGELDTTFQLYPFATVGHSWAAVNTILPLPDGSVLVGGHFNGYDEGPRTSLARVSSTGTLDTTFDPPSTHWRPEGLWWANVSTMLACAEGRVVVPKFGYIRRLNADGTLDSTFHGANAAGGLVPYTETGVFTTGSALQSDGKILIAGNFSIVDGIPINGIVRLNDCVVGSACDDGDPSTANDTINGMCQCAGTPTVCTEDLLLSITLDAFGSQTTWELQDDGSNVVASGGPYADGAAGTVVSEEICVPAGCYHLVVNDDGANGISAGGYVLTDGLGRRVVDASGAFAEASQVMGGPGADILQAFCLPLSGARMLPGLCDKPSRSIAMPIHASVFPGASMYQYWIFDPHGSYNRKLSINSTQFTPGNLVTLPVPTNVDLNICVRPMVDGSYLPFGGVCTYRFVPHHTAGSAPSSMVTGPTITLFPNPNRTRVVNIAFSGMEHAGTPVQVELFDMLGKHAHTGQFPAAEGAFNQVIHLDAALPSGLYLVHITIGGQRSAHRLLLE